MNQNDIHKGNENQDGFVQKDIFQELNIAESCVSDIYNFKEEFRVKTIYENFKGLYSFGEKFKFILSFITGSLAAIGFFFLIYIEGFTGLFSYFLMGLAGLFAAAMSFGLEKARYTIVPIVVKSWLRDNKVQRGLLLAVLSLQIVSISSTIYGTYNAVNLFYTPSLQDDSNAGSEENTLIADYQTKIDTAKADKKKIDKQRDKYHKRTGKPSGWIEHEVYTELTTNISTYEAQIISLRDDIKDEKKEIKAGNETTKKEHAASKYTFVWVSSIISFLTEILLSIVLFFLIKYKFSTLKQLDTIQSPLQTVLNLVNNPLTALKSTLIGGSQLVINQALHSPQIVTNQTGNFDPLNINQASNVPPIVTNSATNISANEPKNTLYEGEKKRRAAGYKIWENSQPKKEPKPGINKKGKKIGVQSVTTDELSKIELKIIHFSSQVKQSENRLKTLKQKAAIEKTKAALKNRKNKLRYWQKKKADFQGKTIA